MESSKELKEAVKFPPLTLADKIKGKRRFKLGLYLLVFFLALIIFIFIKKTHFFLSFKFRNEPKVIVKPVPDLSVEEKINQIIIKLGLKPKEIKRINNNDFEVILRNDLKVILATNKNLEIQLTSLQLLINRFRIEGRTIKKVDLRFKNPIIE